MMHRITIDFESDLEDALRLKERVDTAAMNIAEHRTTTLVPIAASEPAFTYYLERSMTEPVDGVPHYFPAIVVEREAGYSRTNWDYGADYELASEAVKLLNERQGRSEEESQRIVASALRQS